MNQRQREENRRKILNLIRPSNRHRGCFRCNTSETDEHIRLKFELFVYLLKKDYEVYVEPILLDFHRPDCIGIKEGIAHGFEIIVSETLEEAENKIISYPQTLITWHIIKSKEDIESLKSQI